MSNVSWIRIFILFLTLMGLSVVQAQSGEGSALVGTWELRAIEMRGKFSMPDFLQWIVISGDGGFKRATIARPESAAKDTLYETGIWELKGEDLVFHIPAPFSYSDNALAQTRSFQVRSISDSSLVLSGWSGKMPAHLHYHKIGMEEKPITKRRCRKPFSPKRK